MGFWRGVGYFISILMIISGFLGALYTYGLSLVGAVLGFIFIWMLKRGASQQRMEKYMKDVRDIEQERSLRDIADRDKERKIEEELDDAKKKLAEDEKKLADLEKEKEMREKEKRKFSENQEKS